MVTPRAEFLQIPALKTITEAEIGDTLVREGQIFTYDVINLMSPIIAKNSLNASIAISQGQLVAKLSDSNWKYYEASSVVFKPSLVAARTMVGGIKVSHDSAHIELYAGSPYETHMKIELDSSPNMRYGSKMVFEQGGFLQELIYNGRSGDEVKFIYREFSDRTIRGAFTQEAVYDLNESSIIGFKRARIEIIEASNTKIKYRVLSRFGSDLRTE